MRPMSSLGLMLVSLAVCQAAIKKFLLADFYDNTAPHGFFMDVEGYFSPSCGLEAAATDPNRAIKNANARRWNFMDNPTTDTNDPLHNFPSLFKVDDKGTTDPKDDTVEITAWALNAQYPNKWIEITGTLLTWNPEPIRPPGDPIFNPAVKLESCNSCTCESVIDDIVSGGNCDDNVNGGNRDEYEDEMNGRTCKTSAGNPVPESVIADWNFFEGVHFQITAHDSSADGGIDGLKLQFLRKAYFYFQYGPNCANAKTSATFGASTWLDITSQADLTAFNNANGLPDLGAPVTPGSNGCTFDLNLPSPAQMTIDFNFDLIDNESADTGGFGPGDPRCPEPEQAGANPAGFSL